LLLAAGSWVIPRPVQPQASLSDAVAVGDVDLARRLLADSVDPDEPRVLDLTPLMRAALRDDVEMIEVLLTAGADLQATESMGLSSLHIAAQRDSRGAVEALMQAGADIELRSLNGMNTLEHAAAWGSLDVIEYLAGLGADLNSRSEVITQGHGYPRDEGPTALGIAVWSGRLDSVQTLLELGAAVDAPSAAGNTPLLIAVFSGQASELVELLLEEGADPGASAECSRGCSLEGTHDVLEWARALQRTDLVRVLDRY
jgi:ankyrin repeat protein